MEGVGGARDGRAGSIDQARMLLDDESSEQLEGAAKDKAGKGQRVCR